MTPTLGTTKVLDRKGPKRSDEAFIAGLRGDAKLADTFVLQCTELTTDDDIEALAAALEHALAGRREPVRA